MRIVFPIVATIALVAAGCAQAQSKDAPPGPLTRSFDQCVWPTAFDIDLIPDVRQPDAGAALAWFLDEWPYDVRVNVADYERIGTGEHRVRWRLIDDHQRESGILTAERWPEGGWTVIGGQLCRQWPDDGS